MIKLYTKYYNNNNNNNNNYYYNNKNIYEYISDEKFNDFEKTSTYKIIENAIMDYDIEIKMTMTTEHLT